MLRSEQSKKYNYHVSLDETDLFLAMKSRNSVYLKSLVIETRRQCGLVCSLLLQFSISSSLFQPTVPIV